MISFSKLLKLKKALLLVGCMATLSVSHAQDATIGQITEGLFVMSYNARLAVYCDMPPESASAMHRTLASLEGFARENLQAPVVDRALNAGLADLAATQAVATKAELCEPTRLAMLPSMLEDALAEILPVSDE